MRLALTVLAASLAALCASIPAPAAGPLPQVAFETHTLANGLRLLLHVDRKLPIVHVNQWFHVGSKNERPGRTGFAHLFEHMMFQGSRHASGEYFTYAERAGANLREGGVNGTTDFDRTNYFVTTPSGALEYLLWLESDRLVGLLDVLTKEKLDNQRDVVKNERRQGIENVPYGRWFEIVFQSVYPAGHPYSWPVIGSMEDLSAATLDDVKEFFRTYYSPNNLTLVIAGDFDPAAARALVEKYFGSIPPGPALARPVRLPVRLESEKLVVVADRVPQPRTYLAWPAVPYFDPDEASLDLAAEILADGLSARLRKLLVYEKQICSDVKAFQLALEATGLFVINATARPGQPLEEVEALITQVVRTMAREGPTTAELERARNKTEFAFVTGLERIGGFGGKADQLARYATYLGRPDMFETDLGRYRSATTASVRRAVARHLVTPGRVIVRFVPETSERPKEAALDRSKPPSTGADRPFTPPVVQESRLDNGLRLFVVERRDLPKVAVALCVRGGTAHEPPSRAGLAVLAARTLDKGTPGRSALSIEDALGDLGTKLQVSAGREWSTLSLEVLTPNLGRAFGVLCDVALHASYPADEIERERKKLQDDLLQEQRDGPRLARRIAPMLVMGPDHPYGHPATGDKASVDAIARADLRAFHERHFVAANAALVLTGDVSSAQARKLAQSGLGAWRPGTPASAPAQPPRPAAPGKIYLVDRQDAAQTVVMLVLPGIPRGSPDYHRLKIVDAVWGGGGFGTRLNLNLREDKGYSYGVHSNAVFLSRAGWWQASGPVQAKVTRESVAEFVKELDGIAGARPITAAELDDAKHKRLRGYSQSFESLSRIASTIAELWALERPMADIVDEPVELSKVSLESARETARQYAQRVRAIVLVVGDRGAIEAPLRALGAGEIVHLDGQGRAKP